MLGELGIDAFVMDTGNIQPGSSVFTPYLAVSIAVLVLSVAIFATTANQWIELVGLAAFAAGFAVFVPTAGHLVYYHLENRPREPCDYLD